MTGLLAHDDAQRLRSAIADALDVLESSSAVVLPADAFVSTQQAAELLGVSRMTVVRLIDRDELAAEGAGVHRKIEAAEIERYRADTQARRRVALHELAQDIAEDLPAEGAG